MHTTYLEAKIYKLKTQSTKSIDVLSFVRTIKLTSSAVYFKEIHESVFIYIM